MPSKINCTSGSQLIKFHYKFMHYGYPGALWGNFTTIGQSADWSQVWIQCCYVKTGCSRSHCTNEHL